MCSIYVIFQTFSGPRTFFCNVQCKKATHILYQNKFSQNLYILRLIRHQKDQFFPALRYYYFKIGFLNCADRDEIFFQNFARAQKVWLPLLYMSKILDYTGFFLERVVSLVAYKLHNKSKNICYTL